MLNSDFVHEDMPPFTLQSFLRTLTCLPVQRAERWNGNIAEGYRKKTVKILRGGIAQGRLIGGNLTLLCTTIGTPWQPPFRNCILFLEDLSEPPYRFDRMLTYLLNCGLLQQSPASPSASTMTAKIQKQSTRRNIGRRWRMSFVNDCFP
jgi:muramoyltetrapeptide carboxypeptidase